MKKSRTLALFICLGTLISLFSACQSKKTDSQNSQDNSSVVDNIYTDVGTYPILKEGNSMTFTLFAPLRPGVTTYDAKENKFSAFYEKTTGIHFDWKEVNASDFKQKLNVMMTSGEYTDAIMNASFSASEQYLYGKQGVLLPLNDLIDNYAPNLKKLFEKYPHIKQAFTMKDGNIYTLPKIGTSTHMITAYRMWMNDDWLKRLKLDVPKTTDDFYNVLKAFKEKDANGNGNTKDEIPLSGALKAWGGDPMIFLSNAFIPTSVNSKYMTVGKDGKITYNKVTDEWKQCIKYMNKLYKDGLMDKMLYSQGKDQLLKVGSNPEVSLIGASGGGSTAILADPRNIDRWSQYIAIPPLKGPEGVRSASRTVDYGAASFAITNKCKNPEVLIRAMDYFYTVEGGLQNSLGCVGDGRILKAEKGDKNFIGEQAKYTRLNGNEDNICWNSCGPRYTSDEHSLLFSCSQDGTPDTEKILYLSSVNDYIPVAQPMKELVPPISFDLDSARKVIDIETNIVTYVDQTMVEFITGVRDIDKEWDNYVKNVEGYGLSEYLELYQKELDEIKHRN